MLNFAIEFYSIFALVVGSICIVAFWLDSSAPKTEPICWSVIAIATLFWPLVIPVSCWKIISN